MRQMYEARGRYDSGHVFIRRRRIRWGRLVLAALVLALLVTAAYTAFDNGNVRVRTQRVFVADLPEKLEGFTVLHVSDLGGRRFGKNQSELIRALKSSRWDAVVCTGNMLGAEGDPAAFYELISAIGTQKPFYFLAGRSDPAPIRQDHGFYTMMSDWVLGAQSRGAIYLDRPQAMESSGETVWLTEPSLLTLDLDGAAAAYAAAGTQEGAYRYGIVTETVESRKRMEASCGLHLLVSPEPVTEAGARKLLDSADGAFVRTVDLILSGGTAGGQWKLPGGAGVWAIGKWFPDIQLDGYEYTASLLQCVSGGLGEDPQSPLPPFRLFNTPEVTLITFTGMIDLDTLP